MAIGTIIAAVLLSGHSRIAEAHTLLYFSWFKIQRHAQLKGDVVRVVHECRFDPQAGAAVDLTMDTDGDGTISGREIADLCILTSRYMAQDFLVMDAAQQPVMASMDSFSMLPNDEGFRTEITFPVRGTGEVQYEILDPAFLIPALPGEAVTSSSASSVPDGKVLTVDSAGTSGTMLTLSREFRARLKVRIAAADLLTSGVATSADSVTSGAPGAMP